MRWHTVFLSFAALVPLLSSLASAGIPAQSAPDVAAQVEPLPLSEELESWGRIGGLAVDRLGFVYVSNFHDALWRIGPDGEVTTLTRALYGSSGIAIDRRGDVLQSNFFNHTISRVARTGEVTTVVDTGLVAPVGLVVDGTGAIFVCNCGNNTISRVDTDGTVSALASGDLFACPNGITIGDDGNLYVVNYRNDHVVRVSDSGNATILATLPGRDSSQPTSPGGNDLGGNAHIAFARGDLFVTRFHANDIYRVSLDGAMSRLAGTGERGFADGPARTATLSHPNGIAASPDGSALWFNNLAGVWRGEEQTSIVVRRLQLGDAQAATAEGAIPPPALESLTIRVGEMTFDALASGPADGEPVILLHGFPETSYAFRHQLVALGEAGFRAIAPDQRGYSPGARPTGVSDYSMTHLVGDVIGIANALDFETFHLVGHDWGAAVAWVFAARVPDRVRTLTALSTPHVSSFGRALADEDDDQADRSAYFAVFSADDAEDRFLADEATFLRGILAGLDDDAVDQYLAALGTPEAIGAALNWYRASALRSTAGSPASSPPPLTVTAPTLYVWGTADSAFGRGAAEGTSEFVEGPYQFEVIEGAGHWLMERNAARVTALLLAHVTNTDHVRVRATSTVGASS